MFRCIQYTGDLLKVDGEMAKCVGDLNLRDCSIYLDDIVIFPKTLKNKSKGHSSVLAVAEAWPDL